MIWEKEVKLACQKDFWVKHDISSSYAYASYAYVSWHHAPYICVMISCTVYILQCHSTICQMYLAADQDCSCTVMGLFVWVWMHNACSRSTLLDLFHCLLVVCFVACFVCCACLVCTCHWYHWCLFRKISKRFTAGNLYAQAVDAGAADHDAPTVSRLSAMMSSLWLPYHFSCGRVPLLSGSNKWSMPSVMHIMPVNWQWTP